MIMKFIAAAALITILPACSAAEPKPDPAKATAHPFVGCWDNENGQAREAWTIDPSGWLFGYAVNRDDNGNVTFFEQMRIEIKDGQETYIVSAADGASVSFERRDTGDPSEYEYVNPHHDFPQVITYTVSDGRLDAVINVMDGSNPVAFKKQACAK